MSEFTSLLIIALCVAVVSGTTVEHSSLKRRHHGHHMHAHSHGNHHQMKYAIPPWDKVKTLIHMKASTYFLGVPTKGFVDGHNHFGGIVHWYGLILSLPEAQPHLNRYYGGSRFSEQLSCWKNHASALWKSGIDAWDTEQLILYVYQWMRFGRLAGVDFAAMKKVLRDPDSAVTKCLNGLKKANNEFTFIHESMEILRTELLHMAAERVKNIITPTAGFRKANEGSQTGEYNLMNNWVSRIYTGTMSSWSIAGCLHPTYETCAKSNVDSFELKSPECSGTAEFKAEFKFFRSRCTRYFVNIFDALFTANEYLDFDTSYITRGQLFELRSMSSIEDRVAASQRYVDLTIQELFDVGVRYVELFSVNIFPQVYEPNLTLDRVKLFSTGLYNALNSPKLLGKIAVSFFTMVSLSKLFASLKYSEDPGTGKMKRCVYTASDKYLELPYESTIESDPDAEMRKALKDIESNPVIRGIDFAGVELAIYQTESCNEYVPKYLEAMFALAQRIRRRLVFHVHCGEGFPVFNHRNHFDGKVDLPSAVEKERSSCGKTSPVYDGDALMSAYLPKECTGNGPCNWYQMRGICYNRKFKSWEKTCKNIMEPSNHFERLVLTVDVKSGMKHWEVARSNLDCIINAVKRYRSGKTEEQKVEFDKYVRVRLGHVTHASFQQAVDMRDNNIWVDINLASNLATSAYRFTTQELNIKFDTKFDSIHKYLVQNYLIRHGFLKVWLAGTSFLMGTDGSGTEHSGMLPIDVDLARLCVAWLAKWYQDCNRSGKSACRLAEDEIPYAQVKQWYDKQKTEPTDKDTGYKFDDRVDLSLSSEGNLLLPDINALDRLFHFQYVHARWSLNSP